MNVLETAVYFKQKSVQEATTPLHHHLVAEHNFIGSMKGKDIRQQTKLAGYDADMQVIDSTVKHRYGVGTTR
jgi:hypothetical protein